MNPYYDPQLIKKSTFSKWCWIFLWVFPTYVAFDGALATFYKRAGKHVYITGQELLPGRKP
jgi:hypothetical protein